MDEAIAEIAALVAETFKDDGISDVEITPDFLSSRKGGVVPGVFNIKITFPSYGILKQAERQWNADQGFHFVLKDPHAVAMSSADDQPWDEERKQKEKKRIEEGETGIDSIVLELTSDVKNESQPTNYRVNVQFGPNPSNIVSLQVDTGSSILWAQSRLQRNQKIPPGRSVLDVTIAGAAQFQRGSNLYEIFYGNGKKVQFALFEAIVMIGNLKTTQVFGAAAIAPQDNVLPLGIIGLGFAKNNSPIPFHRNLIVQLKESGLIKRASFAFIGPRAEPAGTIKTVAGTTRNRGWLIIGKIDEKYHNEMIWCDVLVKERRSWVVRLNKVTVNGKTICENQFALIDTGSSYLITGKTNCESVAAELRGSIKKGNVTYPKGVLQEFSFTFGAPDREATFLLNDEDLSLGPMPGFDENEIRSPLAYSKELDSESKKDFWVLGGIFIDNMVTVFDYTGDQRIGFASRSTIDPIITDSEL